MPVNGPIPPQPLSLDVFNALHSMSYNSNGACFVDQNNNSIWMFVEQQQQSDAGQWAYGTDAQGGSHPRGNIPQLTADAIRNGQYNQLTQVVAYNQQNYKFRLERDQNGNHIAAAYTV